MIVTRVLQPITERAKSRSSPQLSTSSSPALLVDLKLVVLSEVKKGRLSEGEADDSPQTAGGGRHFPRAVSPGGEPRNEPQRPHSNLPSSAPARVQVFFGPIPPLKSWLATPENSGSDYS